LCVLLGSGTMSSFEFRRDLWCQNTRVPGQLCGIVSVILLLAILKQYWHVTDRWTDTHTHTHNTQPFYCWSGQTHNVSIYYTSIALCDKKTQMPSLFKTLLLKTFYTFVFTDLISTGGNAIAAICPSIRLSVSTLFFKPTEL